MNNRLIPHTNQEQSLMICASCGSLVAALVVLSAARDGREASGRFSGGGGYDMVASDGGGASCS